MTNGHKKGNDFENLVCRYLSRWWCGDSTGEPYVSCSVYDLPFRRQTTDNLPCSGHWDGAGDILHRPDVQDFPFCVEAKKREKWELDGAFYVDKWQPGEWWTQCVDQANSVNLWPLMFFTRNRRPVYCMIQKGVFKCLQQDIPSPILHLAVAPDPVVVFAADALLRLNKSAKTRLMTEAKRTGVI